MSIHKQALSSVIAIAMAGVASFAVAQAPEQSDKAPVRLTEAQMEKIVAGDFVVDTAGNGNLSLIATGNSINSCNNGQCYWENRNGKEIGKPVVF
ncbi:MAG: hypothetical protein JWN94_571 [Betaproteobacteria bacterium]|nr:hypothetical protein [Betaproteobacteria bacterium]